MNTTQDKKLKYKPTLFNILGALAIGIAAWKTIDSGPEGWGFLIVFPSLIFATIVIGIDFFLQKHSTYFQTFLVEFAIIMLFALYYWIFIKGTTS